MSLPDATDLDAAVLARLSADAELLALMPDGVYYARAPQGRQRFVLVVVADHVDAPAFGTRAYEETTYDVAAIAPGSSGAEAEAAAERIDALLEEWTPTVAGYVASPMYRLRRRREPVADTTSPAVSWQHYGGSYRLFASPAE